MSLIIQNCFEHLRELLLRSLNIRPNNKINLLQLDNLLKESGFIQWGLLEKFLSDVLIETDVHRPGKSSVSWADEVGVDVDVGGVELTNAEKEQELDRIHQQGQVEIATICAELVKLIQLNPNAYQSQLSELAGITPYERNNRSIQCLTSQMCQQGIIEPYKIGVHKHFRVINEKPYQPFKRIHRNQYASLSEAETADYLTQCGIEFTPQKTYRDLPRLRYDFLAQCDDHEFLIENNGRQHYDWVPHFQPTREDFEKQQKYDQMKVEYAGDHDLELLVIRYDQKIDAQIDQFLKDRSS